MSAASNTPGCFREFVGKRVVGVLFGALPVNRSDLASGTKTLVFEDGRGLTFASNGSFWIDGVKDVDWAIQRVQDRLEETQGELAEALALAGVRKQAQGAEEGLE